VHEVFKKQNVLFMHPGAVMIAQFEGGLRDGNKHAASCHTVTHTSCSQRVKTWRTHWGT